MQKLSTKLKTVNTQCCVQRQKAPKGPPSAAIRRDKDTARASDNEQSGPEMAKGTAVPILLSEAKELSLEERERGVQGIRETFPEIHQTVAELTLKVQKILRQSCNITPLEKNSFQDRERKERAG